jgi:hypothetical protein
MQAMGGDVNDTAQPAGSRVNETPNGGAFRFWDTYLSMQPGKPWGRLGLFPSPSSG